MVSKEEFDTVQQMICRQPKTRSRRHEFAYTGLIRCGECACAVTATNVRNRFGSRYTYYHCTKKRALCSQPYIRLEEIERQLALRLSDAPGKTNPLASLAIPECRALTRTAILNAVLLNGTLTVTLRPPACSNLSPSGLSQV